MEKIQKKLKSKKQIRKEQKKFRLKLKKDPEYIEYLKINSKKKGGFFEWQFVNEFTKSITQEINEKIAAIVFEKVNKKNET